MEVDGWFDSSNSSSLKEREREEGDNAPGENRNPNSHQHVQNRSIWTCTSSAVGCAFYLRWFINCHVVERERHKK
jgi:hypothetical protein